MYLVIIWGLTLVIPAISVLIAMSLTPNPDIVLIVGTWFTFWGVGIRLLTAGVRQVMQPAFTAKTIFRIQDPEAEKLVSEIGFGNLAMGLVGALTLLVPAWLAPAALTGGLYLGLAGIKHVLNAKRTREETHAMLTDLIVAVICVLFAVITLAR